MKTVTTCPTLQHTNECFRALANKCEFAKICHFANKHGEESRRLLARLLGVGFLQESLILCPSWTFFYVDS